VSTTVKEVLMNFARVFFLTGVITSSPVAHAASSPENSSLEISSFESSLENDALLETSISPEIDALTLTATFGLTPENLAAAGITVQQVQDIAAAMDTSSTAAAESPLLASCGGTPTTDAADSAARGGRAGAVHRDATVATARRQALDSVLAPLPAEARSRLLAVLAAGRAGVCPSYGACAPDASSLRAIAAAEIAEARAVRFGTSLGPDHEALLQRYRTDPARIAARGAMAAQTAAIQQALDVE
jgi:hypothetical protein